MESELIVDSIGNNLELLYYYSNYNINYP